MESGTQKIIGIIIALVVVVSMIPIAFSMGGSTVSQGTYTNEHAVYGVEKTDDFTFVIDGVNSVYKLDGETLSTLGTNKDMNIVSNNFILSHCFQGNSVKINYNNNSSQYSFNTSSKETTLTLNDGTLTITCSAIETIEIEGVEWVIIETTDSTIATHIFNKDSTSTPYYYKEGIVLFKGEYSKDNVYGIVAKDKEVIYGAESNTIVDTTYSYTLVEGDVKLYSSTSHLPYRIDGYTFGVNAYIPIEVSYTITQEQSYPVVYTIIGATMIVLLCGLIYGVIQRNKD